MARDLIIEERQPEEEVQTAIPGNNISRVASTGSTASHSKASANLGTESTIITSSEMETLMHEWTASGQSDLRINPSLADRIQQYLDYQEKLDPLRAKLAERLYKPYLHNNPDLGDSRNFVIYLNEQEIMKAFLYCANNKYHLAHISVLKAILSRLGNSYALYIDTSKDLYINLILYVIANGGSHTYKKVNDEFYLEITL